MEWFATLITDMPLDERRLHGVLVDIAASSHSGSIRPDGLSAFHTFHTDRSPEEDFDLEVRVQPAIMLEASVLHHLRQQGFRPAAVLEFHTQANVGITEELWLVVEQYALQLRGWILKRTEQGDAEELIAADQWERRIS